MRKPKTPNIPNRTATTRDEKTELMIGTVVGVLPGSNYIKVRLTGYEEKSINNVISVEGLGLSAGDSIVIARIPNSRSLVALSKVAPTTGTGDTSLAGMVYPPTDFAVVGMNDGILCTWTAWSGVSYCYQVQHNASAAETGADSFYTYGSHFVYNDAPNTYRYFRARSVHYDVRSGKVYYSGWTSWAGVKVRRDIVMLNKMIDKYMKNHIVDGTGS